MKKDSFEKKLAAYVAMATAYLAAHPVEANAQILYNDVMPDVVMNNSFFNLDLNQDGINDYKISNSHGVIHNTSTYGYQGSTEHFWKDIITPFNQNKMNDAGCSYYDGVVKPFILSSQIGPSNQFGNNGILRVETNSTNWVWGYAYGAYNFSSNGCFFNATNFVGLKLNVGGIDYYGWARVSVGYPNKQITLYDYAINLTPNSPLSAGVVPSCPMPGNPHQLVLSNHSVKLSWNTQASAIGYRIRYRVVGTSSWIYSLVPSNTGLKFINSLSPNTNYEWQVRTICQQTPLVWSNYTASQFFATPLRLEDETVDKGVAETQNELFIYPNPATSEIHLLIGEGGDYELKIFNMLGQQVAVEKENLRQDESVTVSTSNLPSGTYQILVTSNEGNFVGRFVKE